MNAARRLPPLDHLRGALPQLPGRLRAAGRFVVDHAFDAATRSMPNSADDAGLESTSLTRLAHALGHSGWEDFRIHLVVARTSESSGDHILLAPPYSARPEHIDIIVDRLGAAIDAAVTTIN